jgi:hypothetical protein
MNLRAFLACLLAIPAFALLLPLTACDATSDDGDDSTDAASRLTDCSTPDTGPRDAGTDAKSDAKVVCCPIDEPSCDVTRLGGSPDQNGRCASAIADAPPTFSSYIDENGCPAYRVSGNGSCLTRDAGYDADADAASTDAGAL